MKQPRGLDAVRSAVRAMAASRGRRLAEAAGGLRPVVTISRQGGVPAAPVAQRLVHILNERDGDDSPWIEYDRQLVERVAADHNLAADLVARFDEQDRSWFEHFTAGITGSPTGTDIAMKTAQTIRALAWVGRAVIIGRGSQAILSGLAHVVHVRLFAPLKWRIGNYPRSGDMDDGDVEQAIGEIDAERARYVKQHFGKDVRDDFLYDIVLNMGRISADRAARILACAVENLDSS